MLRHLVGALGACLIIGPATAHVTLENRETPVGAAYKAVLRVPHGCEGTATISLRVRIPEGVIRAKPMPKPGWTLDKVRGKYAATYEQYGAKVDEGLTEVAWKGGNLPDDEYDEFVVRGSIAKELKPGATLYFAVVQECGDATDRWIEIPADGQDADELAHPAPALKLVEGKSSH